MTSDDSLALANSTDNIFGSGVHVKDQIIIRAQPEMHHLEDFWKQVTENKIKLIVSLDFSESEEKCPLEGLYEQMATKKITLTYNTFTIGSRTLETTDLWKETLVKVHSSESGHSSVVYLEALFKVPEPQTILRFLEHARLLSEDADEMLMFMCKDGITHSGLACVLFILLDKIDEDGYVIVPLDVGSIKSIAPDVIPSVEQYKILYEVLQKYFEKSI